MPTFPITDPADPRLADYQTLTDVDLRTKFEPPRGIFIAEGELVIRRALAAGYPPRSIFTSDKWLPGIQAALGECDPPVFLADPALMEQVTGYHVHRGALGSFSRKALPTLAEILAGPADRLVVLENVNTHTNLGAIFRAAAGLGFDAVVLSPSCTDPLYRRSVRVSMGTVFAIPFTRAEMWPEAIGQIRDAGFAVAALTPAPDAVDLPQLEAAPPPKLAVLLGAEGPGLTEAAMARSDLRVRIPMSGQVDSLNVAAAAAVTFYACRRPESLRRSAISGAS